MRPHRPAQLRIRNKPPQSGGKIANIKCPGNETGVAMLNELTWPPQIRNDTGQARSLRLQDDVPECVCRAWKHKDVSRSIGGRQLLALEITSVTDLGRRFS